MKHRYNDLDLALESEAYFRELACGIDIMARRLRLAGEYPKSLVMRSEHARLAMRHKWECAAIERLKGVRDA